MNVEFVEYFISSLEFCEIFGVYHKPQTHINFPQRDTQSFRVGSSKDVD